MQKSIAEIIRADPMLDWHLRTGHYDSRTTSFLYVARLALRLVSEGQDAAEIQMPTGETRTAAEVVAGLGS